MAVKKKLRFGLLLFAGSSGACGGGAEGPLVMSDESSDESAESSTGVSPLLPGAGAAEELEEGGAALEPASCAPAECPEVLLFGVLVPGCCRFGNLCGGRVQVSERTSACLAPEVNAQGEELRQALARASREPFVADATCPSHNIDGDELPGCCRAGSCGVDTQPWTRSAAALGLQLPRACLDLGQAGELANEPVSSAPPPRCRD